jgi:SAM-dependent methyltransferase
MFSITYLSTLRRAELDSTMSLFPPHSRVLEIGAGTGDQAAALKSHDFDVVAVDLTGSYYSQVRVFPVLDYDGRTLPFSDASFDVVFTSNALEHVRNLPQMHREIRRVLKPNGICIHVLPTHAWRFWTMLAAYPMLFSYLGIFLAKPSQRTGYELIRQIAICCLQPRHGERRIGLSEIYHFHPRWWITHFQSNGFIVRDHQPIGLFYTGEMLFGPRLSIATRQKLSRVLGSACHVFKLERSRM